MFTSPSGVGLSQTSKKLQNFSLGRIYLKKKKKEEEEGSTFHDERNL